MIQINILLSAMATLPFSNFLWNWNWATFEQKVSDYNNFLQNTREQNKHFCLSLWFQMEPMPWVWLRALRK